MCIRDRCSIALGRPTVSTLAVLGEISISGTILKVDELANSLQEMCIRDRYGADTLEENLDYIAKALGNKGSTSREIIRCV